MGFNNWDGLVVTLSEERFEYMNKQIQSKDEMILDLQNDRLADAEEIDFLTDKVNQQFKTIVDQANKLLDMSRKTNETIGQYEKEERALLTTLQLFDERIGELENTNDALNAENDSLAVIIQAQSSEINLLNLVRSLVSPNPTE